MQIKITARVECRDRPKAFDVFSVAVLQKVVPETALTVPSPREHARLHKLPGSLQYKDLWVLTELVLKGSLQPNVRL